MAKNVVYTIDFNVTNAQAQADNLAKSLKQVEDNINGVNKAAKGFKVPNDSQGVKATNAALQEQAGLFNQLKQKLAELKVARGAAMSKGEISVINKEILATTTQLNALKTAGTGTFFSGLIKGAKEAFNVFAGAGVLTAGSLFLGSIVKVGMEFEKSMSNIKAVTSATTKEIEQLTAQAKLLGATTMFSAQQAADAMTEYATAGFTTTQIMAAMPGTLSLASAGLLDVGEAAKFTVSVMTGYGMTVKDITRINDVMVTAAANGTTTVRGMGEAFRDAAPAASNAGWALEETAAALTLIQQAGIPATMAGVSLRQAIQQLVNVNSRASKNLKDYGISVFDAQGKMKSLTEIFKMFEERGLSVLQVQSMLGAEAGRLALVMKAGIPAFEELTAKLKLSGPAAKEAALGFSDASGVMEVLKLSGLTAANQLGKASTELKKAYDQMVNPASALSIKLKDLGIATKDGEGKMVPMSNLLSQLSQKLDMTKISAGDASQVVKLFGEDTGQYMFRLLKRGGEAVDSYNGYLAGLGGSTYQQAKIQQDNFKGSLDQLLSAVETLQIELFALGEKVLRPFVIILADAVTGVVSFVSFMAELPSTISENKALFILLATAVIGFNWALVKTTASLILTNLNMKYTAASMRLNIILTNASTVAANLYNSALRTGAVIQAVFTNSTRAAAEAQLGFNLTMAANPIMAMVAALALLTAGIVMLITHYEQWFTSAGKVKAISDDISKDAAESVAKEIKDLKALKYELDSDVTSRERRAEIIGQINSLYTVYLPYLIQETTSQKELAFALSEVETNTMNAAKAKIAAKLYEEEMNTSLENEIKLRQMIQNLDPAEQKRVNDELDALDKLKGSIGAYNNVYRQAAEIRQHIDERINVGIETSDGPEKERLLAVKAGLEADLKLKEAYLTKNANLNEKNIAELNKRAKNLSDHFVTGAGFSGAIDFVKYFLPYVDSLSGVTAEMNNAFTRSQRVLDAQGVAIKGLTPAMKDETQAVKDQTAGLGPHNNARDRSIKIREWERKVIEAETKAMRDNSHFMMDNTTKLKAAIEARSVKFPDPLGESLYKTAGAVKVLTDEVSKRTEDAYRNLAEQRDHALAHLKKQRDNAERDYQTSLSQEEKDRDKNLKYKLQYLRSEEKYREQVELVGRNFNEQALVIVMEHYQDLIQLEQNAYYLRLNNLDIFTREMIEKNRQLMMDLEDMELEFANFKNKELIMTSDAYADSITRSYELRIKREEEGYRKLMEVQKASRERDEQLQAIIPQAQEEVKYVTDDNEPNRKVESDQLFNVYSQVSLTDDLKNLDIFYAEAHDLAKNGMLTMEAANKILSQAEHFKEIAVTDEEIAAADDRVKRAKHLMEVLQSTIDTSNHNLDILEKERLANKQQYINATIDMEIKQLKILELNMRMRMELIDEELRGNQQILDENIELLNISESIYYNSQVRMFKMGFDIREQFKRYDKTYHGQVINALIAAEKDRLMYLKKAHEDTLALIKKHQDDKARLEKRVADLPEGAERDKANKDLEDLKAKDAGLEAESKKYEHAVKKQGLVVQDAEEKRNAEIRDRRRKMFLDFTNGIQEMTQTVASGLNEIWQIQMANIEKAITRQQKAVDNLTERASRSKRKGDAEQLKLEQDRLDKLNAQKEDFVKKQRTLAMAELIINTVILVARAAAEGGGVGAAFTIAAALASLALGLVAAREMATQGFREGGYTGSGGRRIGGDHDVAGTVHAGEFVMDKSKTSKYRPYFEDIHKGHVDVANVFSKANKMDKLSSGTLGDVLSTFGFSNLLENGGLKAFIDKEKFNLLSSNLQVKDLHDRERLSKLFGGAGIEAHLNSAEMKAALASLGDYSGNTSLEKVINTSSTVTKDMVLKELSSVTLGGMVDRQRLQQIFNNSNIKDISKREQLQKILESTSVREVLDSLNLSANGLSVELTDKNRIAALLEGADLKKLLTSKALGGGGELLDTLSKLGSSKTLDTAGLDRIIGSYTLSDILKKAYLDHILEDGTIRGISDRLNISSIANLDGIKDRLFANGSSIGDDYKSTLTGMTMADLVGNRFLVHEALRPHTEMIKAALGRVGVNELISADRKHIAGLEAKVNSLLFNPTQFSASTLKGIINSGALGDRLSGLESLSKPLNGFLANARTQDALSSFISSMNTPNNIAASQLKFIPNLMHNPQVTVNNAINLDLDELKWGLKEVVNEVRQLRSVNNHMTPSSMTDTVAREMMVRDRIRKRTGSR